MSEYDYQNDSDEDEELQPAITCIKAMPQQRESIVYGDGLGNLVLFDTRARRGEAMSLYSRSSDGGHLVDLRGGFAHKGGVTAVEVLGDGTHIVSGGRDGTVCVWETRTGARLISEASHSDAVTEITALGGQEIMTTSLDSKVKVWDCRTLEVNSFSHIHQKGVLCAARLRTNAPEEKVVVSGSRDDAPEGLALWSAHGGASTDRVYGHLHGHTGPVSSLTAVGLRTVLSGGGLACRRVKLWEFDLVYGRGQKEGQVRWGPKSVFDLGTHRGSVTACCAIGGYDAACSAGSDGCLRIWRLKSRVLAAILQDDDKEGDRARASSNSMLLPPLPSSPVKSESLSKSSSGGRGSMLEAEAAAAGGGGGSGSGRSDLRTTGGIAAAEGIMSVCSTADGSCLVSGSTGGRLKVWDVETQHVLAEKFLKHEGGDTYQRMGDAVRRSLPGMNGGKMGSSRSGKQRRPISLGGGSEPTSPNSALEPHHHEGGGGSFDSRPGSTHSFGANNNHSPASSPAPLGSQAWQNTMQVQSDVIQRLPSSLPAELHAGPRYGHHVRPTTGSVVSSGGGSVFAETSRNLALPRRP